MTILLTINGFKVEVGRTVANTTTYTAIAGITGSPSLPEATMDKIDVSSLDSPNGVKEFIPGWIEYGDVGIEHNYVKGSQTDILLTNLSGSREIIKLRFTLPGANTSVKEEFSGFLAGYNKSAEVTGVVKATANFTITGVI